MEQIQGEYGSWVSVEMWNVEGRVERAGCREDLRQEQVVPCCTGVIPAEGQLRMRGHKVPMSAKDDPTRNGCGLGRLSRTWGPCDRACAAGPRPGSRPYSRGQPAPGANPRGNQLALLVPRHSTFRRRPNFRTRPESAPCSHSQGG